MRRTRIYSLLLAASCVLALGGPTGVAAALDPGALCVSQQPHDTCFHSIQAAVDAAPAGGRIDVAGGTYKEAVTITKAVTLTGDNRRAVIDATGHTQGIFIHGPSTSGTMVSGFTVENALLEGILAQDTSQIHVVNNTVRTNDRGWVAPVSPDAMATCPGALPFDQDDCGEGLHFNGVASSFIEGNTVERNVGGILLTDEAAANHDNLVTHNIVRDNDRDCGITLPSHPSGFGPNGPLPGNGVFNNTISYNLSAHNGGAGVGTFTPTPGTASYNNKIIGNTLTDNGLPGVALHSHAFGQNLNGNQVIGNFIAGNAGDPDAQTGGPTGIVIFADKAGNAAPITGMTITNNTITREAVDVWIGNVAEDLSLHSNNLLGANLVGVKNTGSGVVDATNNWWGCPRGPEAPGCSKVQGSVTFAPWLTHKVQGPIT